MLPGCLMGGASATTPDSGSFTQPTAYRINRPRTLPGSAQGRHSRRTEVTALRAAGETRRYCTGVEVLSRDDRQTRTLDADLVVDASGAHSKTAEWLRQLRLELPEDEVIDGHNGYSSPGSAKPDQAWPPDWWWKVVFLRLATPEHPYFIAFFPIENRRWLLSYIGVNRQYPPSREDQFTSALAKLLLRLSMRWCGRWSRSLRFIPAVRPGIGGAITNDGGSRLETSSRSLTQPVHTIQDLARE